MRKLLLKGLNELREDFFRDDFQDLEVLKIPAVCLIYYLINATYLRKVDKEYPRFLRLKLKI